MTNPSSAASPNTGRILIVERDQHVREFQEYFLARAGFDVEFADDGEAALAMIQARPPTALVTEIMIPRIDGLSLCRRLREDPATSDVPIIIFSILAAGGRAAEAGASAFIRKPLVEHVFIETVRNAITARNTPLMEQQ